MEQDTRSPRITHISWGRLEVDGRRSFKDARLYPGGAREWDWNETGTRHVPGIQPADVEELLQHGAEVGLAGAFEQNVTVSRVLRIQKRP